MSDEDNRAPLPAVGRGRGRGGVPLLPVGVWDALNGSNERAEQPVEQFLNQAKDDKHNDRFADANEDAFRFSFSSFGGRRGGRDGRGPHGGRGRGRGPEDLRGKDWDCPSCTNVNWSWRTHCNKCNTVKPAAVVSENERRDGAAGGFNERQDRVSASAIEIDEEGFDDFGRRVKKSAKADKQAKEEAALKRMQDKYKHLLPNGESSESSTKKNDNVSISHAKIPTAQDENWERRDKAADSEQGKKRHHSPEQQHRRRDDHIHTRYTEDNRAYRDKDLSGDRNRDRESFDKRRRSRSRSLGRRNSGADHKRGRDERR
jgi:hypothetical protein